MDKENKLDALFQQAKKQEPKTSFDQTKNVFLVSLNTLVSTSKGIKLFTLIKISSMLSAIISITGILLFMNGNPKKESIEKIDLSKTNNSKSKIEHNVNQVINKKEKPEKEDIKYAIKNQSLNKVPEWTNKQTVYEEFNLPLYPINKYIPYPKMKYMVDDSIPKLTDKDIEIILGQVKKLGSKL